MTKEELINVIDVLEKEYENVTPDWGILGYVTYKRTYARWMPKKKRHEEFNNTVARVLRGAVNIGTQYTEQEVRDLFDAMFKMKVLPAGRDLWQLGTKLTEGNIGNSLINCWFVTMNKVSKFGFIFDQLMLGGGVGFSVENKYISQLPVVKKVNYVKTGESPYPFKDEPDIVEFGKHGVFLNGDDSCVTYLVGDSREGFVTLLNTILESYFETGNSVMYDMSNVRRRGAKINGFGGHAVGKTVVKQQIKKIVQLLDGAVGRKLTSLEVMDLICMIGQIVVSGNVRRTALISIGDYNDIEYLKAKRWDIGIPDYRAMVNCSVICNNDDIEKMPQEFWDSYTKAGEAYGLINLENAKKFGRTGKHKESDIADYFFPIFGDVLADKNVVGVNPCQPEFAHMMTPDGIRQFKDINVGDKIWSEDGWVNVVKKWSNGVKPVYKYQTTAGSFIGTDKHRIKSGGIKIEVDKADDIDLLEGYIHNNGEVIPEVVMDGLMIGDGSVHKASQTKVYLSIGKDDQDYFTNEITKDLILGDHAVRKGESYKVQTSITEDELPLLPERVIPDRFFYGNHNVVKSFLKGLYSANGSVIGNGRVTLKTTSFKLLEQVQTMLSSVGIRSYYTTNKPKLIEWKNGTYESKQSYDLNISSDRDVFYNTIGFLQEYKMDKLYNTLVDRKLSKTVKNHDIISKEYLGDFEVFDMTVDGKHHTYWSAGLNVSNCAEATLEDYGICCLAELIMPKITSKDEMVYLAKLIYKLKKHVTQMDYTHPEAQKVINYSARIGIGVTGVMDAVEKIKWLSDVYRELREFDVEYSRKNGFNPSRKLTVIKPSGCQVKETLLTTNEGILHLDEIGDINGEEWQSHDIKVIQTDKDKEYKSTKFYRNGFSETKKILLSSGLELESTPNHKYKILRGNSLEWVKAEEIKNGDIFPFRLGGYKNKDNYQHFTHIDEYFYNSLGRKRKRKIKQPNVLNEEIAYILGLYTGDGSNHKAGIRIAGNINQTEILEKASDIFYKYFHTSNKIYKRTNGENNADLYITSRDIVKFFAANNILKNKSDEIEIPEIIRRSPVSVINAFIDGYTDADGCRKTNGLSWVTVSQKMAQQLVVVGRAIGRDLKFRIMPPTKSSWGNRMRYWISERKERTSGNRYAKKYKKEVWEKLDNLGLNHFGFDEVVEITDSENETFDIEVPENNCYIANSFISHNTISTMAGVSPGIHPSYSRYYFRTIRMASEDPLVKICRKNGYRVEYAVTKTNEDGSVVEDKKTCVIYFPVKIAEEIVTADMIDTMTQLDYVQALQQEFVDQSISVTAYYTEENLDEIKQWLEINWHSLKTVSFLKYSGHGFLQAPYQPISKKEYEEAIKKVNPIEPNKVVGHEKENLELIDQQDCEGGVCPIK